jgi:hypothetical protein
MSVKDTLIDLILSSGLKEEVGMAAMKFQLESMIATITTDRLIKILIEDGEAELVDLIMGDRTVSLSLKLEIAKAT